MNGAVRQCQEPTCHNRTKFVLENWDNGERSYSCSNHLPSFVKRLGQAVVWELEKEDESGRDKGGR